MNHLTDYQAVDLPQGRALGVLQSGLADGKAIFFFPGFGVSAHAIHPEASLAASLGIRVIAVDRPGIGKSMVSQKRSLLDWARDVEALADILGIDRFGVLGWSGGGPHALACAYSLPDRIVAAGLFACAPPFTDSSAVNRMPSKVRVFARVARLAPIIIRFGAWNHCRQLKLDADSLLAKSTRDLSDADRETIFDGRYHPSLQASMIEACMQGPQGLIDDILVIANSWGFDFEQVSCPVCVWHAEEDRTIPVQVGHFFASKLRNSRARFIPGGGHFSYLTHWSEILLSLAETI